MSLLALRAVLLAILAFVGNGVRDVDKAADNIEDSGGVEVENLVNEGAREHLLKVASGSNIEEFLAAVAANAEGAAGSLMEQGEQGIVRMAWPTAWQGKLSVNAKEVGRGSFGAVYVAELRCDQTAVAAKAMKAARNKVEGEADLLKAFSSSPFFIAYYAHDEFRPSSGSPTFYILMEPANGGSFGNALEKAPSWEQLQVLFVDIVEGVYQMHQKHIVHRDLKPANVLVSELCSNQFLPCRAKIADLGESCYNGDAARRPGAVAACSGITGTPYYLAPESWRGAGASSANDVWAMGLMLYQILFGSLPVAFEAARDQVALKIQILAFDISTDRKFKSAWPAAKAPFKPLLLEMLRQDTRSRIKSSDLLEALNKIVDRPAPRAPSRLPSCWDTPVAPDEVKPSVPLPLPFAPQPRAGGANPGAAKKPEVVPHKPEAVPHMPQAVPGPKKDPLVAQAQAAAVQPARKQDARVREENRRLKSYRPDVSDEVTFFTITSFTTPKADLLLSDSGTLINAKGVVQQAITGATNKKYLKGVPLKPGDQVLKVNDIPWPKLMALESMSTRNHMKDGSLGTLTFDYKKSR